MQSSHALTPASGVPVLAIDTKPPRVHADVYTGARAFSLHGVGDTVGAGVAGASVGVAVVGADVVGASVSGAPVVVVAIISGGSSWTEPLMFEAWRLQS